MGFHGDRSQQVEGGSVKDLHLVRASIIDDEELVRVAVISHGVWRLGTLNFTYYFARAQIDHFHCFIVLCGQEEALPGKIQLKMVEIAIMEPRQWNRLDEFQRLIDRILR